METIGSRRLDKWLASRKLSNASFADKVDTTRTLVWSWRKGRKVPGRESALRIERTARIPVSAWSQPVR